MRELKYRSIIYYMRKGNVVAKAYNSPFVPPLKARVDVRDSQGNELHLIVVGNATYRHGTDDDMASIFVDVPVLTTNDEMFGDESFL